MADEDERGGTDVTDNHDTERALLAEMVDAIDAVHMALIFPELGALRDRARAVLARERVAVAWCEPVPVTTVFVDWSKPNDPDRW
jgi:hypothetical protein